MDSIHIPDLSCNLLFFQTDAGICIQYNRKIGKKKYIGIYYAGCTLSPSAFSESRARVVRDETGRVRNSVSL